MSERLVVSEVEAEYQAAWGLDFVKAVVDTVCQLAAEVVERGEAEVVLQWSRRLSVLTQVCSGWRADVICLASGGQCQISARARKVGELRQVKLRSMLKKRQKVVIARADYVSSWPVVKHRLAGGDVVGRFGTALEQAVHTALDAVAVVGVVGSSKVPDFGVGSVEPRQ